MAQTITSGILANDGVTIRPLGGVTWADLDSSPYATWENWTSWTTEAQNIQVSETVNTGTSDYYVPMATVETLGDVTITVDYSDTGLFSGEETTITFPTENVVTDIAKGKYVRWNFTVAPNAADATPYLFYNVQANNAPVDIYLEDVSVPSLPTDSLGFRLIDHPLGAVKHVQATTLQGDDYVDNGYYLTYDLLDSYVRTANTSLVTEDGTMTYVDGYKPRLGKAIKFNGTNQAIELDNSGGDLIDTYPYTIEFLFKVPPISASDNRGAGRYLFADDWSEASPALDLLIRVDEGDSTGSDSRLFVQISGMAEGAIPHTPFPIQGDRWYHYSLTFYSSTSIRSMVATLDGENSGDGVGEGPGDSFTRSAGDFNYASVIPPKFYLGKEYIVAPLYVSWTDVEIDEFRITNGAEENATNYWSSGLLVTPLTSRPNTTLLLHFDDNTTDDNLVRTGTEDYTYRQNGGSAVVETKNPLALKVVDYNGDPWDGAVDLHLRGVPKVIKLGNQLSIKYDN